MSPAPRSAEPTIVATGLGRFYGEVVALNDVAFTLGPGITGLLGPNGAGKSTLLRILVGQLRPSRGAVRVLSASPFANPEVLARIGYCPEHDGVWDSLTALELVGSLVELSGYGPTEARRRAAVALATLDLESAQHRRVGEFSKGMRQRVKLAQAIAHDPEVLFLDEPLTGCDPLARIHVLAAIRALGERGATVLLSTHVLQEIEAVTSRVLVLHRGGIVAEGDVHEIRGLIDRHPHHIRVACDDPRRLARALVDGPDIAAVSFDPNDARALVIETRAPDACYPRIPEVARREGIAIAELTSPDDNLQAVFRYLTSAGSGAGLGAGPGSGPARTTR
jgi:ABC-2 type transport system ATP-binding protein